MTVKLSDRTARAILRHYDGGGFTSAGPLRAYEELRAGLATAGRKSGRAGEARHRKKLQREASHAETNALWHALWRRSGGHCEYARAAELDSGLCAALDGCQGRLTLEHFRGRGKELQSEANTWLVCFHHQEQKTLNQPSAEHWLRAFLLHLERWLPFLGGERQAVWEAEAEWIRGRLQFVQVRGASPAAPGSIR